MDLLPAVVGVFRLACRFALAVIELARACRHHSLVCMSVVLSFTAPVAHAGSGSASVSERREETRGFATYYASRFDGRRTASGATFSNDTLTAAHPTLPFGTLVRVTNLARAQSVVVRVVDRGPGLGPLSKGVIIDLSQRAAKHLNMMHRGRVRVGLEVLAPGYAAPALHPPFTLEARPTLVLRLDTTPVSVERLAPTGLAHCSADCSTASGGLQLQIAHASSPHDAPQ
jgi:rare lipoprotein A